MHQEITVIGELIAGPAFEYTFAGPCCTFVVNVEDPDGGGIFFRCVIYGLLAETCWRTLKPGLEVAVIGRLKLDSGIMPDNSGEMWMDACVLAQEVWNRDENEIPYLLEGSQMEED